MKEQLGTPADILKRLALWETAHNRPVAPMDDTLAKTALEAKGVTDDEVKHKLSQLSIHGQAASPRMLASYADLHAINHLYDANQFMDLSQNPAAGNVRAVLQAAEIAMLNTRDLAQRVKTDIEAGHIGAAEEKYRWISSFQQTLHSLSLLAAKFPVPRGGYEISIADSPSTGGCLADLKALHTAMEKAGLISAEHIGGHDIYESSRNLTHQAFVDTTYTDLWLKGLHSISVPKMTPNAGEDSRDFYQRFIGTPSLNLAVNELNQKGDNFLRQFRAYHQMSEILVGRANELICDSIKIVLSPEGNLMQAKDNMEAALNMLDIMNQNVVPILRNLSVNKYQEIRGSLGITSGSHSMNIKHGLFTALYPLFTEAVKLRVMDLQSYQDANLRERLHTIIDNPTCDHATHDIYELLCQANQLHVALRTWRDLHMQFVKTQIGVSPGDATPTASISGAPNAVQSANMMRQISHGSKDAIVPVYETLMGKNFPSAPPFANVFRSGDEFAHAMGAATAEVVAERSQAVQNRVHHKGKV